MGIKSRLPKMKLEMKTGAGKKVSQTMRIVCAYCGRCIGEKEGIWNGPVGVYEVPPFNHGTRLLVSDKDG